MRRIIDGQGHSWPVTGVRCTVCGWPIIITEKNQTVHPTCEEPNQ